MTDRYDAIIIGAGHNGLVCAATLAKAGKNVLVLEANAQVGGVAVTREFAEGFSVSACAHYLYQLQPEVQKELKLDIEFVAEDLTTIALGDDGEHVRLSGDSVGGVSDTDAEQYQRFRKRMTRFSDLLQGFLNQAPPRLGTKDVKDLFTLAKLGIDLRRLGREEMREFLRLIGMNIHDELNERFDSGLLKGAISLDAVLGTHLGPRSPNTIMTYLYRLAGSHGSVSQPKGGMGSVAEALAHAARSYGVTIRTSMPVARIMIAAGRAVGVEAANGERFESMTIVSNADPKRTIMQMVGARHVEAGFASRVEHIRMRGNTAKLHLALDGLPTIAGLSRSDFAERMIIAPDEHYVESAFNPAKYGESSPSPIVEMSFPGFRDETLAPAGKQVLSAVVQYAPYDLQGGWTGEARATFEKAIIDTIAKYVPDIKQRITASELLTPVDIEKEFHISGGHWHHGELTLDQFFFVRPVSGAAQYRMPIDGVYLCGAGAHPGGGVSGAAGRNAAKVILQAEKMQ